MVVKQPLNKALFLGRVAGALKWYVPSTIGWNHTLFSPIPLTNKSTHSIEGKGVSNHHKRLWGLTQKKDTVWDILTPGYCIHTGSFFNQIGELVSWVYLFVWVCQEKSRNCWYFTVIQFSNYLLDFMNSLPDSGSWTYTVCHECVPFKHHKNHM